MQCRLQKRRDAASGAACPPRSKNSSVVPRSMWLTLISGPRAMQFQFLNSSAEYAVPNSFNNCSQYQTRIAAQITEMVGIASFPNFLRHFV